MDSVFTEGERRRLAGRARFLGELLRNRSSEDPAGSSPRNPEKVLERWEGMYPDEQAFEQRLQRESVTRPDVRSAVRDTAWPPDDPLPEWIDRLEALIEYVETSNPDDHRSGLLPAETPFRAFLEAVAAFAVESLDDSEIATDARGPAIEQLGRRLRELAVRPLYVEFRSYVEHFDPSLAAADPAAYGEPPTEYYEQFITELFDGGSRSIFLEYPVLGRLTTTVLHNWNRSLGDLERRLGVDRPLLERRFGVEGPVTKLAPLSTDTHGRGAVPFRVTFEKGAVVYKPRSVEAEAAFGTILERMNEHLDVPSFETPTVVPRDEYGWMEVVETAALDGGLTPDAYYEQAGALLCLADVLRCPDLQFENVVATDRGPVIVDAETLCHHRREPEALHDETDTRLAVQDTLLQTGLLPFVIGGGDTPEPATGGATTAGFGETSEERRLPGISRPKIVAPNTDVMSVESTSPTVDQGQNTPTVAGDDCPPGEFVESMVSGFTHTYDRIRELRDSERFLGDVVPVSAVAGCETRYLFRPSMEYQSVLRSITSRAALRDGVSFSLELEGLAVPLFDDEFDTDRYWPLFAAERRAIRRFDVPRITTRPDSPVLEHDGRPTGAAVSSSGLGAVEERLATLSDEGRATQATVIRQCLGDDESRQQPTPSPSIDIDDRVSTARQLVERVLDSEIASPGRRRWVTAAGDVDTLCIRPVDLSLYDGRAGIALAAAGLYEVTGRDRYARIATTITRSVLDCVSGHRDSLPAGGFVGLGSVLYTGTVVADLVADDRLGQTVRTVIHRLSEERLENASRLGVLEGIGGTALALLAHYDRTGDEVALERAVHCGDQLVAAASGTETGLVWETGPDDTVTIGFAHGMSGISYALSRLADTTGATRFAEAASEGFASVRAAGRTAYDFDREADDQDEWWCRGWPGVGLAVLGGSDTLDRITVPAFVDERLSSDGSVSPLDHVCCGNFGRVLVRIAAAEMDNYDPARAEQLATDICRKRCGDTFMLPNDSSRWGAPTFFNGRSGIAYGLLRLHQPNSLPCALLLE